MNRPPVTLAAPRLAVALGMLAVTANIAGCATPAAPVNAMPDDTATTTATPATPAATNTAVTDQESCEAFTDVSTILQNAMADQYDGRMGQPEYDGWMRLATRVLDRVPTRGEGAVSDAIAALKEAAPAVPAGTYSAARIGTPEWYSAAPLADACNAAGYPLFAEGFTGG